MFTITMSIIAATLALAYAAWLLFRLKSLKAQITELNERYNANPSYDCQMFMADVMSGKGLFKIERVDRENLFLRR